MKNVVLVLMAICALVSCKERGENSDCRKIVLNPNSVEEKMYLSEIVDSVILIPLETTEECVIDRAKSLIIKDKYIYIMDVGQDIVFVFNKSGKFISKLDKKGRGPHEYSDLSGMFIDDAEKNITVINSSKNTQLLTYSNLTFDFINKKQMPSISSNSVRRLNGSFYFATNRIQNEIGGVKSNACILQVKEGTVVKRFFDKKLNVGKDAFIPFGESFTVSDSKQLYASIMYDSKFYELQNDHFKPILEVEFEGDVLDNSIGKKSIREQIEYYQTNEHLASFPVLNVNNSNVLSFSYFFRRNKIENKLSHYIEFKKSRRKFHVKKIINDLTAYPEDLLISTYFHNPDHEVWYKDYLVDVFPPAITFKDEETKRYVEGVGEIKIDDNPVIVLMKLKKGL